MRKPFDPFLDFLIEDVRDIEFPEAFMENAPLHLSNALECIAPSRKCRALIAQIGRMPASLAVCTGTDHERQKETIFRTIEALRDEMDHCDPSETPTPSQV